MAEYYGTTVDAIFDTQDKRFRPEGAEGVDAVIAYDISGEGGGKWKLTIKEGTCKTEKVEGDLGGYTVKLETDAETFVGITVGQVDGTEAFSAGKLKVDGELPLMMKLPQMFQKFSPPAKSVTAADIIESMPERFRPEEAKGLDVTIGYDLHGEGGGQWTAVIRDGKCTLEEGLSANLTTTNIVSAKDYVDLMLGKLDPMVAFGAGRLKLAGDMELAQKLPKLFSKFEPKDAEQGPELIVLKRTISVDMKYATGPVMGKFFEGLREKKIFANVCPECGRHQLPPREVCADCRCRVYDFMEVGPEGILTRVEDTYYASPDPLTGETRETPYGSIHILLDGCKGRQTFWHMLKKDDLFDVKVGDRVRPVWNDERVGSVNDILYFEKVK